MSDSDAERLQNGQCESPQFAIGQTVYRIHIEWGPHREEKYVLCTGTVFVHDGRQHIATTVGSGRVEVATYYYGLWWDSVEKATRVHREYAERLREGADAKLDELEGCARAAPAARQGQ